MAKVTQKEFSQMCKKYGIELGDLPAFPPKTFFDNKENLEEFLKNLSEAKKNGTNNQNK